MACIASTRRLTKTTPAAVIVVAGNAVPDETKIYERFPLLLTSLSSVSTQLLDPPSRSSSDTCHSLSFSLSDFFTRAAIEYERVARLVVPRRNVEEGLDNRSQAANG